MHATKTGEVPVGELKGPEAMVSGKTYYMSIYVTKLGTPCKQVRSKESLGVTHIVLQ